MTVAQIQSQTIRLAYMVIRSASQAQISAQWETDLNFSPLQNSFLLMVALRRDTFPTLRRFEAWDLVETGFLDSLYKMPNRTLSYAEQSSLAMKIERQYHELQTILPIRCPKVDLVR